MSNMPQVFVLRIEVALRPNFSKAKFLTLINIHELITENTSQSPFQIDLTSSCEMSLDSIETIDKLVERIMKYYIL